MDAYSRFATAFVLGLDLGQARDHSALIVNMKSVGYESEVIHSICFAHRWPLGTTFPQVARETANFMTQLPRLPDQPILFADATGLGRPVMDLLRDQGLNPRPVILTGGSNWSLGPDNMIRLPASILASGIGAALQTGRLRIAGSLPHLDQLVRELSAYRVRSSAAGNDQYGSRTEADHDDLVCALGLSVFGAARDWSGPRRVFFSVGRL